MMYFNAPQGQVVKAIPGAGLKIPIWILGSSLYGAQLAAELGLPYAFASHFAPALMMNAIEVYRSRFRPSEELKHPHVMLGINVITADTDEEARRLFTSHQQVFVNLRRGTPGPLPPPNERAVAQLSEQERWELDQSLSVAVVGSLATVQRGIEEFIGRTNADELIIVAQVFDHAARLRSYEMTAQLHTLLDSRSIAD
jgi:luciferase family oxidoreductase group 1